MLITTFALNIYAPSCTRVQILSHSQIPLLEGFQLQAWWTGHQWDVWEPEGAACASISAQGYHVPVCLFRKPSNWHSLGRLVTREKKESFHWSPKRECVRLCVRALCLCPRENQNVANFYALVNCGICVSWKRSCKNESTSFLVHHKRLKSQNTLLLCEITFEDRLISH